MNRFPLLEQMRAERQRREDEITAPLREELMACAIAIRGLRSTLREIERMMGSEIAKYMVEEIAHQLSEQLRRLIFEAVAQKNGWAEPLIVAIPADVVRFIDQNSLERSILAQYAQEGLPALQLGVEPDRERKATYLDIRIPPVGYRRAIVR